MWGPAGLSVAHGHDALQVGFYDKLWSAATGPVTLPSGRWCRRATKTSSLRTACCQDVTRTFVLLGDPLTPARVQPLDATYLSGIHVTEVHAPLTEKTYMSGIHATPSDSHNARLPIHPARAHCCLRPQSAGRPAQAGRRRRHRRAEPRGRRRGHALRRAVQHRRPGRRARQQPPAGRRPPLRSPQVRDHRRAADRGRPLRGGVGAGLQRSRGGCSNRQPVEVNRWSLAALLFGAAVQGATGWWEMRPRRTPSRARCCARMRDIPWPAWPSAPRCWPGSYSPGSASNGADAAAALIVAVFIAKVGVRHRAREHPAAGG